MTLEEARQIIDDIVCNQRTVDLEAETTVRDHHLSKSYKVVYEIARISKIGGRVVIELREARRDML